MKLIEETYKEIEITLWDIIGKLREREANKPTLSPSFPMENKK